ncbi:SWF or SNF family helicase [Streptomyces sp. NBC_00654]|uniref:SWIM zinc finger family protein n=1 Tax=Streptomyces sp. NBC_00654 TaxID=2975799 RepID=UPI0022563385|nr:SWF or SNF family helicase [Streptomyces sp. NBC_00654]MCX4966716.1 SWF or SNF family helicase [Streptomyces sp. NBC_00654]
MSHAYENDAYENDAYDDDRSNELSEELGEELGDEPNDGQDYGESYGHDFGAGYGQGADGRGGPERTFAALPPAQGRGFASSWWGQAWLKALEDTALDGEQLKKGRRLAREGKVGAVSVRPGRITAVVQDRDATPYRSDVLLQQLSGDEWDRFLDMAVDRAGHIAALLDREMPPHLVEDAAAAGVDLLPGIGDLEPECGCEAWDHCPHSGALCYQVARLLDQDPFVLLLMRGRDERRLLDELQVRSAARAVRDARGEPPDTADRGGIGARRGVSAEEAYAAGGIVPPLPEPPPVPAEPGLPPSLDTETDPAPGLDPAALELLATDSAARAHRMLLDALAPGHEHQPLPVELTPDQDAVRLAAETAPESWIATRLATGSGRRRAELDAAVRAWRYGGSAALAVLEDEWDPDPESLARAQAQLAGAWEEGERPQLRAGRARWTVTGADVQLRYGRDGRWWPYRKDRGRWIPAGPADDDPAGALAASRADA